MPLQPVNLVFSQSIFYTTFLLGGRILATTIEWQPHAEASNFAAGGSKQDGYNRLLESMRHLAEDQRNWVCNTANAAALLWGLFHSLPLPSSSVNWAGFYTSDPKDPTQLILGPFQGKVACQTIKIGKGVCGSAAEKKQTILLQDVEEFPGHIACDADSKSEIVVPIKVNNACVAVIDVDCADLNGFDEVDQQNLEKLATILAETCDW